MTEDEFATMSDTQLPRFQVFLQAKPGLPHQDAGSVHAPDPEMALLNARDVFVRRPECASLWVVPAEAIFSRTRQQLETGLETSPSAQTEAEAYFVACKQRPNGTQTILGEVRACSPAEALGLALENYSLTPPPFAWWVFPARLVLSSDPAEADSLFDPALHKPFRLSTDFHTLTEMRLLEKQRTKKESEPGKPPLKPARVDS
jgi:ring-1,2-phenylacetyl-CoA epoxidase subunit PaaB